MLSYPLYFTFKGVIPCKDSKALLVAKARVLMTIEDDEVWLYGVQPGGMAAFGKSRQEAFVNFRVAFANILVDIESEAANGEEFDQAARRFFHDIDKQDAKVWEESREGIRSGKINPPNDLDNLEKIKDDPETINIILVPPQAGENNIVGNEVPWKQAA